MKNIIAVILGIASSMLIATLFMDVSSSPSENVTPVMGEIGEIKAFQVGAFESIEKATDVANEKQGIVVSDDNLNYVYIAILSNSLNIERMINYLDSINSYYYFSINYYR